MSTGLLNQLEAYYADVEATHHDVTPDRVLGYIDRVREVPTPAPVPVMLQPKAPIAGAFVRSWRRPILAAAAAAAVVLAISVPLLLSSRGSDAPPVSPSSTVSTTAPVAEDATPTTAVPGVEAIPPDATDGSPDWSWTSVQDVPGQRSIFRVDDLFITIDASGPRARQAAESGSTDYDPVSYYWWSVDGEQWQQAELPDVGANPIGWHVEVEERRLTAYGGLPETFDDFQPQSFAFDTGEAGLTFDPVEPTASSVDEPPEAKIPEMDASGLVPTAFFAPDQRTVGDVVLLEGAIHFKLPEDVRDRLPGIREFPGEDGPGEDDGWSSRQYRGSEIVAEWWWNVNGQRISVEILSYEGGEPRTIHTGWADAPPGLVPSNSQQFTFFGESIEVLWRSTDGGRTFVPIQPEPIAQYDARTAGSGRYLHEFNGRFLWYIDGRNEERAQYSVLSSVDGLTWTQETEDAGDIHGGSLVKIDGRLLTPNQSGMMISSDGIEWTQISTPGQHQGLMEFDGGLGFLGRDGTIYTSTNGEQWNPITLPDEVSSNIDNWYPTFHDGWILMKNLEEGTVWIGLAP